MRLRFRLTPSPGSFGVLRRPDDSAGVCAAGGAYLQAGKGYLTVTDCFDGSVSEVPLDGSHCWQGLSVQQAVARTGLPLSEGMNDPWLVRRHRSASLRASHRLLRELNLPCEEELPPRLAPGRATRPAGQRTARLMRAAARLSRLMDAGHSPQAAVSLYVREWAQPVAAGAQPLWSLPPAQRPIAMALLDDSDLLARSGYDQLAGHLPAHLERERSQIAADVWAYLKDLRQTQS